MSNPMRVRAVEAEIRQQCGRLYQIDWAKLDDRELCEVHRMLRDLEHDRLVAVRRGRLQPWRG